MRKIDKPITYRQWTGVDPPEITITLHTVHVHADRRILRVEWTPEMLQDIAAYHNINAVDELEFVLSEEIRREIDNLIFNRVTVLAANTYLVNDNLIINKPKRFYAP